MGLADITAMREQAVELRLDDGAMPQLEAALERLAAAAREEVREQGVADARIRVARRAHLRYEGTDSALIVAFGASADMVARFEAAYRQRFSFLMPDRALIVEAVSVEASSTGSGLPASAPVGTDAGRGRANWRGTACRNRRHVHRRRAPSALRSTAARPLRPGDGIDGPAIIAEANATTVVEPGWRAEVTSLDHLVLDRVAAPVRTTAVGTSVDPVMLEIFNNLFMSIAEQMGFALANTAYSVNIKERLDFSCALFDADGNLIANAPHMPVHLGSMGESIKTVIRLNAGRMGAGDVYVLNAPYNGGTHLPDITVITPVFDDAGARVLFYVGSRGHHADVGGITPGSMPPDSRTVEEEGVLIDNFLLVERGRLREAETIALLSSGRYPARNVAQNMADLRAMIAANAKGVQELRPHGPALRPGRGARIHAPRAGQCRGGGAARDRACLRDGEFTYEMDCGGVIRVRIAIDRAARRATIDFTGTSAQLPNNYNAPSAVCMAAVLYVFRTLVDDDIPLNAGCLKPLDVIIPEGSMLRPRYPAAVVAGNVETSQCITDALYGALGIMASAQGTMNNFTFGNDRYQYYETIAGGSGAGATALAPDGTAVDGFDGTDVVQTHMTNSRLTDPEVLEWRFPVLLESYEIRRGSGGAGRWRGGDGGTRRIRFLEAMTASILANHRRIAPHGMAGGTARRGRTQLGRASRRSADRARPRGPRGDGAGRRVRDRDARRAAASARPRAEPRRRAGPTVRAPDLFPQRRQDAGGDRAALALFHGWVHPRGARIRKFHGGMTVAYWQGAKGSAPFAIPNPRGTPRPGDPAEIA